MSFLAPLYLLLGAAAAVPLLLHLMRRRTDARIDFPAVRYLVRTEREHSQSLRRRHLLLLVLRVLMVLVLALAAARPMIAGVGAGHPPTAVAIVLDNSLSTAALSGGRPVFERLRAAVRELLEEATDADRLWLVTAEGRVFGGTRAALRDEVARLVVSEDAGDLPLAVRRAAGAVRASGPFAGVVAVATDGQLSAWRGVPRGEVPVAVLVPPGSPPPNRSVAEVWTRPARWTPVGALGARIEGPDSVGYRAEIDGRPVARGTAPGGGVVEVRLSPAARGWQALRVQIDPDDFAADDARSAAVWIGPPPAARADPSAGPFVATAVSTLAGEGRLAVGSEIVVTAADVASARPALLTPPADPVRLGAANRALARLGVPWRFGPAVAVPARALGGRMEGVLVTKRYSLERTGAAASETLSTAGGAPWIVAGAGYVLVASPLDPQATTLPLRAVFLPWLADVLAQRLAAPVGELATPLRARPGAPVSLPAEVDEWESESGVRRAVSGGATSAPTQRGVWFLRHGGHRIGALVVGAPPEESALERLSAASLASRLAGSRGQGGGEAVSWVRAAFAAGSRRSVLVPLLALALSLLAIESLVLRPSRPT